MNKGHDAEHKARRLEKDTDVLKGKWQDQMCTKSPSANLTHSVKLTDDTLSNACSVLAKLQFRAPAYVHD